MKAAQGKNIGEVSEADGRARVTEEIMAKTKDSTET